MEKRLKIKITEIFMAKCGRTGWDRCFHGTIRRETDNMGNPVVISKIKIGEGHIIATAKDQWELGDRLDKMVLMVLDYGLHDDEGISSMIAGTHYFLN